MQPFPNPKITRAEMRAAVQAQVAEERAEFAPLLLDPAQNQVPVWLRETPPPMKFLFANTLPAGVVGAVGGPGGSGKSLFLLGLNLSGAVGRPYGPFKPTAPCPTIYVGSEDSEPEIWRRLFAIGQAWRLTEEELALAERNLFVYSMVGRMRPIMELDSSGNPATTATFQSLMDSIAAHPLPGLLTLDPKSRLTTLEENRNEYATAFVREVERLPLEFPGMTVLLVHHAPKSLSGVERMDASSVLRGAGGLGDGVRWVLGMRPMTEKDATIHDVDRLEYAEVAVVKNNGGPETPPIYFRRAEGGVLLPANLLRNRLQNIAEALVEALPRHGQDMSLRDLTKSPAASLRKELKHTIAGLTNSLLNKAAEFALEQGTLEQVTIQTGPKQTPKAVLRVRSGA